MMNRAQLVGALAVIVAASVARAQPAPPPPPPPPPADPAIGLVQAALTNREPGALVALMGARVRFDLRRTTCPRPVRRKGTATSARRAAVARCLTSLGVPDAAATVVRRGGRTTIGVYLGDDHGISEVAIELAPAAGGLAIAAVTATPWTPPPDDAELDGVEGGVVGGVVGGAVGGVVGGVVGPPPPPPPPPPTSPQVVPPVALESLRVAGDKDLIPDAATQAEILRAGKTRLVIPIKVCLDQTGAVVNVTVLKASGFPAYDRALVAGVRSWRYRPYKINGAPARVCSIVNFVYTQH